MLTWLTRVAASNQTLVQWTKSEAGRRMERQARQPNQNPMNTTSSTPLPGNSPKELHEARTRVAAAESALEVAREERQSARKKREAAKEAARRAKKRLRQARKECKTARQALIDAEKQVTRAIQSATLAPAKPAASTPPAIKKPARRRVRVRTIKPIVAAKPAAPTTQTAPTTPATPADGTAGSDAAVSVPPPEAAPMAQ